MAEGWEATFGRAVDAFARGDDEEGHTLLADAAEASVDAPQGSEGGDPVRRVHDALALARDRLTPGHPVHADVLALAGHILVRLRRPVAARAAFREALELRAPGLPPDHPELLQLQWGLFNACGQEGDYPVAEEMWVKVAPALARLADGHPIRELFERARAVLRRTAERHGRALAAAGRADELEAAGALAEAEAVLRRAIAELAEALDPRHPDLLAAVRRLAALVARQGRHEESRHIEAALLAAEGMER